MTLIMLVLFGTGVLFIISAIENVSIKDTVQAILNGEDFDLSIKK